MNKNGKKINSDRFNNYVYTQKGGIQNYNDEVGIEYIKAYIAQHPDFINAELGDECILSFISQHSDALNARIAQEAKKSRLKVVCS